MSVEYVIQKIEKMRKERGWSISYLTSLTELSGNTIYKWLTHKVKSSPTVDALQSVCDAFGISMATLFAKDENAEQNIENIEILSLYNGLTKEQQENVKQTMVLLSRNNKSHSEREP